MLRRLNSARLISLFALIWLFGRVNCSAGESAGSAIESFRRGETLVYELRYMGIISCGRAALEAKEAIYEGRRAYMLSLKFESSRLISLFRKVEWTINSYMDAEKLHALYYEELSKRGGRVEKRWIRYNQSEHQAILGEDEKWVDAETGIARNYSAKGSPKLPPDIHDLLSWLYFIRTRDGAKDLTFYINERWKNYRIDAKYFEQNKLSLSAAPKPKLALWMKYPAVIYFGHDERKVPLAIKVYTYAGIFDVKLIGQQP